MSTNRRKLLRTGGIALVLVVFSYFTRGFWVKILAIFFLGTLEHRVQKFGRELYDCDGVEIVAVSGRPGDPDGVAGSFLEYPATARLRLSDEASKKAVDAWISLARGQVFSGKCHQPPYGLRFFRGNKLVFETTVCWDCSNYTIPMPFLGRVEYGFDEKNSDAKDLLTLLQEALPETDPP
jgi:hypothetical protein